MKIDFDTGNIARLTIAYSVFLSGKTLSLTCAKRLVQLGINPRFFLANTLCLENIPDNTLMVHFKGK